MIQSGLRSLMAFYYVNLAFLQHISFTLHSNETSVKNSSACHDLTMDISLRDLNLFGSHCPDEPASGAAETGRAKSDQVREGFAVSASHMQWGNLTAPTQTHTDTRLTSHSEWQRRALCIFSLVLSCNASAQVGTSFDVEAGQMRLMLLSASCGRNFNTSNQSDQGVAL